METEKTKKTNINQRIEQSNEIKIMKTRQSQKISKSASTRGIMQVVKENIRKVTLEVAQEKETEKSLWKLVDNNRSNIIIGVIYVLQENIISSNELKIMYNNISKQILIAQEKRQQVLILGDFNAKVGTYIEGNRPTVTKW